MSNQQKINKIVFSLLLILFFVSFVNAQQAINTIEDLTNVLKEKSQPLVEKFDSFYQSEILTRRCSENETMNEWYAEKREDIANFASNLALNLYNNASNENKEATLSFLIDEIENLTQASLEREAFLENLTTQVCNGIPIKIYPINELLDLIEQSNQKYVDKYNTFLNEQITIYEKCKNPQFYEQRKEELRNFNLDWVKNNYEKATDKENSLRILNEMLWEFDKSTANLELSYENITRKYCNSLRKGFNYSVVFWIIGLAFIFYILYYFTKKDKRRK